ncbi:MULTISPECIES: hypothetical protein [unclassified Brachybacterium]|uniref:hypothetical protein n=1 Tax=unclassified Brachybacterium TaxID=2623841 RepID=UPI003F914AAA
MQRPLAVLLILIGIIGLVLGRLGETTWAPETETTATVALDDPGSAVVIDPGVLYVGGEEGKVVIEGASDVSVITAANGDIDAYLEDVRYTRITGADDWTTLSTLEVNPEGAAELTDPTTSDLWRSVETKPSPYTIDVADFWAGENGENAQAYRPLLIVTDGTAPGADKVSITWPVDAENEWVPFAYAGGAAIAVIGLVLLVVSIGGRRRDEDEDWSVEDGEPGVADQAAPALAGAAAGGSEAVATVDESDADEPDVDSADLTSADAAPADAAPADGAAAGAAPADDVAAGTETAGTDPVPEESVWSLGTPGTPGTEDDDSDPAGPVRLFGDDEERR